ncbi:MAG: ferrous iron transport protein A [Erysipelotrichaceae bacterium]|nr:ferrous iron transport protein A [Erysipelotrichaceae bacterium]MCI9523897.1 ferrous iron transport protein A [Erysipelotrichaceae bacterium]
MTLSEAKLHEQIVVMYLENEGSIRRRLMDLGILPDTVMEPVLASPSGHMRSYFVKGTMIALREQESDCIYVKKRG